MSDVESALSVEQRARAEALEVAREVLAGRTVLSSSPVHPQEVITLAEFILGCDAASMARRIQAIVDDAEAKPATTPEADQDGSLGLVDQSGDDGGQVLDCDEHAGEHAADVVAAFRRELARLRAESSEKRSRFLEDVFGVVGHDEHLPIGDGQARDTPDTVACTIAEDSDTEPIGGVGEGAAAVPPAAAPETDQGGPR